VQISNYIKYDTMKK